MPNPNDHQYHDSWFAPISLDMVVKVAKVTIVHPFICWLVPLCLRSQAMSYENPRMQQAIAWAVFITLCWMGGFINNRIAYGLPRHVNLNHEVIVITGGASGLGLLIAEVYGMRGATVAVLDVVELESGEARGVTYYKCDVTDRERLVEVVKEIERDLGLPTVLINNAGIVVGKTLLDMSVTEIEKSIHVNLLAHFYTLKAFLPCLTKARNGGTVVTVSSVLGQVGSAQLTDYAACKAGLSAMHRSLEAELRITHPNMRMVLVEPGQLSTPMFMGVKTPSSFFAPIVEPVDVAKEIITAIDSGKAGHVSTPLYARWIGWFNVLPAGAQRIARYIAGVDDAMKTYVGRASKEQKKN
ncbi:Short-chain dehydrogenase/reductase family 16C member 6 [Ceratocystis lukuohia]|uniref:Short-chain dehydrogenase/reductase family 16C member 6 n=3 Tax=Ceratocystis TaxID=5157 RepID=A0A0F8B453_CERFI|nr:Short-chain dehydrogenase/reductase family 16C member 6 [Ceratocystis platani]PHH51740.1 putative oxidoreductase YDL114W [Ceratocystis fimbriata CBS 114723]